jgi:GntR family transcriptional regulator
MGSVNKDLPIPLYHQLKDVLLAQIESGKWQSNQQLPNENKLAEHFGVSKIAVRQALQELSNLGYVRREQGRGTFVSKPRFNEGPRELTSFTEEMRRHHLDATSRVLECKMIEADAAIAEPLQISEGDAVFVLKRLRMASGEPMGIQTAHVPASLVPGILDVNFEKVSLYEVLHSKYGVEPTTARETYFAVLADESAAELLQVPAGSPAFAAERIALSQTGKPFEVVQSIMRGDRYRIVLNLVK